jgi:hypothetical protein
MTQDRCLLLLEEKTRTSGRARLKWSALGVHDEHA